MSQVKTVKVRHLDDDTFATRGYIIINEADFDPGLHQRERVALKKSKRTKKKSANKTEE